MAEDDSGVPPQIEILIIAPRFQLGQIVATPGALQALERAGESEATFLARHASADWGELDEEDKASNDYDMEHGGRLLSAYRLNDGSKLWIITEYDRSYTTLLLPQEY